MRTFCLRLLSVSLLLIGLISAPAMAQELRVIVPDHPNGIPVSGCFRADRPLFGPYQLTFCLDRRGTYQVRGGGIRCDGQLTSRTAGRDILVDIHRTSCGNRRAWEAATMECRHTGGLLGQLAGRILDVPRLSSLRCTYYPSVPNRGPRTFTANRI